MRPPLATRLRATARFLNGRLCALLVLPFPAMLGNEFVAAGSQSDYAKTPPK